MNNIITNNKKKISTGAAMLLIAGSIIAKEGGYVNNPKDPGGETNLGITKNVAIEAGYTGLMKNLTVSKAKQIYVDYYISPNFKPFVDNSFAVAHKASDMAANLGVSRSVKFLQISLNDLSAGGSYYSQIKVDGKVGKATEEAYSKLIKLRGNIEACKMVLKMLDNKQMNHYLSLNSSNLLTFRHGWIIHRIENVPLTECETGADSLATT